MFNSQFSILIRKEKRPHVCEPFRHPRRMRIEHWELSIGQIPGRIQGSGFCQVIFCPIPKRLNAGFRSLHPSD
jgi:hypothetical protein